jgi:hypothetical protein
MRWHVTAGSQCGNTGMRQPGSAKQKRADRCYARSGMKIRLVEESLLPDLLAFLRKEGCVAYYEGGGIEAVRPHSFGEQEATELRLVINRWRNEHPEEQIELSD